MQSQFTTKLNYFVANLQQGYKERLNKRLKMTTTTISLKWDELVGSSYPNTTLISPSHHTGNLQITCNNRIVDSQSQLTDSFTYVPCPLSFLISRWTKGQIELIACTLQIHNEHEDNHEWSPLQQVFPSRHSVRTTTPWPCSLTQYFSMFL